MLIQVVHLLLYFKTVNDSSMFLTLTYMSYWCMLTYLFTVTFTKVFYHKLNVKYRIVKKYRHDPWKMRLISKHFYLEEVFDDSMPGPNLRWRYRNFFGDNVDQDQGTHGDSQDVSQKASPSVIHDNFDREKTDLKSEQITVSALSFLGIVASL